MTTTIVNVFSVDVEEWFHILALEHGIAREAWSVQENRVEANTERILDLLWRHGTQATCFVLGWIAERYPSLVEAVYLAGHEIATHGYGHELVYEQGPDRFRTDLERSIDVLNSLLPVSPRGYRAPGFSITRKSLWAFSILAELGLAYDSSVFPLSRNHGGLPNGCSVPHCIQLAEGRSLIELPITTAKVYGQPVACCGGGYLRLLPLKYICRAIREANALGIPVVLYIHPRDIDPEQPRISMPLLRRFKSYVGLHTAYDKLHAILQEFPFGRADQLVQRVTLDTAPRVQVSSGRLVQVETSRIVAE